jgi:3-oxoacyl-[acyl-carrier protein] reductase
VGGLAGTVAVVTGAARRRGIGRGIVEALAEEGCRLAINDVAAVDEAAELLDDLAAQGASARFYEADVSDRAAVERMLDAIGDELGPLEIACSNAGVARWQNFHEITDDAFDAVVDVNLTGAFNIGQSAARRMAARYVTGAFLRVDGGLVVGKY